MVKMKKKFRKIKYFFQKMFTGYCNEDYWSPRDAIAKYSLELLKHLRNLKYGCPGNLSEKKWYTILDKIILGFELIIRDNGNGNWTDEEYDQIKIGLKLFSEYYLALWE